MKKVLEYIFKLFLINLNISIQSAKEAETASSRKLKNNRTVNYWYAEMSFLENK